MQSYRISGLSLNIIPIVSSNQQGNVEVIFFNYTDRITNANGISRVNMKNAENYQTGNAYSSYRAVLPMTYLYDSFVPILGAV